jgi:uncharacterized protein
VGKYRNVKQRFLVVDGHSIIFAWPDLRKLHARRQSLARDELVRRLTLYGDAAGVRVVFVFDGRGEKHSEALAPEGVQIFYAAEGRTADDIVERLAAKYAKIYDMTVATCDYLEQQTVAAFGALPIDAVQLLLEVESVEREFRSRIAKHNRK